MVIDSVLHHVLTLQKVFGQNQMHDQPTDESCCLDSLPDITRFLVIVNDHTKEDCNKNKLT
jgi:hypothetical protein